MIDLLEYGSEIAAHVVSLFLDFENCSLSVVSDIYILIKDKTILWVNSFIELEGLILVLWRSHVFFVGVSIEKTWHVVSPRRCNSLIIEILTIRLLHMHRMNSTTLNSPGIIVRDESATSRISINFGPVVKKIIVVSGSPPVPIVAYRRWLRLGC